MQIFLAILLGTIFGFVLHRIGASNPEKIINMLRLKDFHLMKTILWGIAIASALLFVGLGTGLINPKHLSVKTSEWGVIIGGALLGIGWTVAGYCPGTGLVALGDGRKDAIPFIAGGLVGAFAYMLSFGAIKDTFLLAKIAGGKTTLAATPSAYEALITGVPGIVVALVIAVAFAAVAKLLPDSKN